MTVQEHNRKARDRQVELGNEWTIPISAEASDPSSRFCAVFFATKAEKR